MAQDSVGSVQPLTTANTDQLNSIQQELGLNEDQRSQLAKVAEKTSNPGQFLDMLQKALEQGSGSNPTGGSGGGDGAGGIMQMLLQLIEKILQQMHDKVQGLESLFGQGGAGAGAGGGGGV